LPDSAPKHPVIAIHMPEPWGAFFCEHLSKKLPDINFRSWDTSGCLDEISYVLAVQPAEGDLNKLPNLKAIIVIGAGADHVLCLKNLPDVPIARLPQPDMRQRMTEYILLHVLRIHRQQQQYDKQQDEKTWKMLFPQPTATERNIVILGAGYLGRHAAVALKNIGFQVSLWSRRSSDLEGIKSFHGGKQLQQALSKAEILISLLPLTPQTDKLLSTEALSCLPKGAAIINASRGGIVDDDALLRSLDTEHISAAVLDAFTIEPLPSDHPYWEHPNVTITPHCASAATPEAVAPILYETVAKFENNQSPDFLVSRTAGY